MAGSPAYTSDVVRNSTYGESLKITGSLSVANSGIAVTGFGTLFNSELSGDEITFTTDGGTSITRLVEAIISDTSNFISWRWWFRCFNKTIARNRGKVQFK